MVDASAAWRCRSWVVNVVPRRASVLCSSVVVVVDWILRSAVSWSVVLGPWSLVLGAWGVGSLAARRARVGRWAPLVRPSLALIGGSEGSGRLAGAGVVRVWVRVKGVWVCLHARCCRLRRSCLPAGLFLPSIYGPKPKQAIAANSLPPALPPRSAASFGSRFHQTHTHAACDA